MTIILRHLLLRGHLKIRVLLLHLLELGERLRLFGHRILLVYLRALTTCVRIDEVKILRELKFLLSLILRSMVAQLNLIKLRVPHLLPKDE
jgi:hypothetical protein